MSGWTQTNDIRKRLERKWNSGAILAHCVRPRSPDVHPLVPLRIPLKNPTARELAHQFDAARTWVDHLVRHAAPPGRNGYAIEWREFSHQTLGRNRIPVAVVFSTMDDILSFIGRTRQAGRYQDLYQQITGRFPELADLLTEKPLAVLAHDTVWDELLAIAACLRDTPCPGIYLRQLEIPGVDTKFIEHHKSWLDKLLTRVLPAGAVNENAAGPAAFERRFGFLSKPVRIRFRTLDPALTIMGLSDMEIPETDFHHLPVTPDTVFIVENEISGLSFPPVPGALVIFGLGYGLAALSDARWMDRLPIWYWGDIDTHGFAMLDRIRHHFPDTRSFLMDEDTLLSHKAFWGREPSPLSRDLPLLTADEARVYDALRRNRHAAHLRLEQERISFAMVRRAVEQIRAAGTGHKEIQ